jgi:hypothetical protein
MNVIAAKLFNGQDIVAKEEDGILHLVRVLILQPSDMPGRVQILFPPFLTANYDTPIPKDSLFQPIFYRPSADIENAYLQQTSPIKMAKSSIIAN